MPYISKEKRECLKERQPLEPGELNYLISKMVNDYLARKTLSYTHLNEVAGVLACVQMEVYRRVAVPYEDYKLAENSEVFTVL